MKTLITFAFIAGIISLYFVVNAENSLVFKGSALKSNVKGEITPLGTDFVGLASKKFQEFKEKLVSNSSEKLSLSKDILNSNPKNILPSLSIEPEKIPEKASNFIYKIADSLKETIEKSIKQKLNQTFCEVNK